MNVFSLTPQHLVICKVSLFSFEQKKGANYNTCYSHSPLLPLPVLEAFRDWNTLNNSRKVFARHGCSEQPRTDEITYRLGVLVPTLRHYDNTTSFLFSETVLLFSVRCFFLTVFVLWVLSYFLPGDFYLVLNSIRGVLRSSIQAWKYWNAVNVTPTAHLAPYFNSRCKSMSHCLSKKSSRDILRVNIRCSPSIRQMQ